MKNLTLINNVWFERKNPNITDEEKIILSNMQETNSGLREITLTNIHNRSILPTTSEDAILAQNIYEQYNPTNSTLISVDIMLPDGHGIINCKLNNEHQQIRF